MTQPKSKSSSMRTADIDTVLETTFTPVTERNLSHVTMLAHRIWPVVYADILTPEQIRNMLLLIYSRENLEKEMRDGHQFWIAYKGIKPVGYASAYRENEIIWLKKLYVDPDSQGHRIGAKLMHTAVSPFLPAEEIRLLVNPNNTPAQRFYTHMGFTKIGEVPVQMGDWDFVDHLFSMSLTPHE